MGPGLLRVGEFQGENGHNINCREEENIYGTLFVLKKELAHVRRASCEFQGVLIMRCMALLKLSLLNEAAHVAQATHVRKMICDFRGAPIT